MPTTVQVFTDVEVNNQALSALGEDRISSLSDTNARAVVMREHYAAVTEFCLTRCNWRFATSKVTLSKLSGTPVSRWAAAWQLPNDKLKVLSTWPASNYEINGNRLLTNEQTKVDLDYIRVVPEGE